MVHRERAPFDTLVHRHYIAEDAMVHEERTASNTHVISVCFTMIVMVHEERTASNTHGVGSIEDNLGYGPRGKNGVQHRHPLVFVGYLS